MQHAFFRKHESEKGEKEMSHDSELVVLPLVDFASKKSQEKEKQHQRELESRAWLLVDDMKRRKASHV
jgi:hypothetical protein